MTRNRKVESGTAFVLASLFLLLYFPPTSAGSDASSVKEVEIDIGVGYDSNPFLAPDDPYLDQRTLETVSPPRESGFYTPASLAGRYETMLGQGPHAFSAAYRLGGDFYPDSTVRNAEETRASLEPGFRFALGESRDRDWFVYVTPLVSYSKEIYFDRETGLGAEVSGVDASDRYSYLGFGGETGVELEVSRIVELSIGAGLEQRDYEDIAGLESYDHDRYRLAAGITLKPSKRARLYLDYARELRRYDERTSKSLNGDSPDTNPTLEYAFQILETSLRIRPTRAWTLQIDADRKIRDDEYVGYNDYTQTSYRVRSTVQSERRRLELSARYRAREYENAFIFDLPTDPLSGAPNPNKHYTGLDLALTGEVRWKRHLRLFAKVEHEDRDSADPRFAYRRAQVVTGIGWIY